MDPQDHTEEQFPEQFSHEDERVTPSDWELIPHLKFPLLPQKPSYLPSSPAPEETLPVTDKMPVPPQKKAGPITRRWRIYKRYHTRKLPRWYRPRESLANLKRYWKRPKHLVLGVLFILLCVLFVLQSSVYWMAVIDDSYITFRFVDMFVKGNGWRFSPEGPRVEGFTNFLWAVLLVVPDMLKMDLMFVSKVMGVSSGILTMAAAWGFARAVRGRDDLFNLIPPALLATNAHFAHWGQMGLETLLQCALVTATYYRFEKERRDSRLWLLSPLIAVLAAMTRIDSLFYLSPLGLYGWWLVLMQRMPVKRLLLWATIAAVPFGLYQGWRLMYFGDWAPNTYYAKQRMVIFEGHARGEIQLWDYYFDQADYPKREPVLLTEISKDDPRATVKKLDRMAWDLGLVKWNSFLWMNFWLVSAVLCGMAAGTRLLVPRQRWRRRRKRSRFLRDVHLPKIFCLILLPWGMNVYYIHHVNGDWMPSFRFFQVILPFIGVAGAVGFGWVVQLTHALTPRKPLRFIAWVGSGGLAFWLLFGTAAEQLRTNSVFIFGPGSEYWGEREPQWTSKIFDYFDKGFSPPLGDVADFLLMETQDDGWIFMSDIGQPLWFAEHLNLFDVDGLTDPYLAHAPSVRGDLPTVEEHFQNLLTERNLDPETMDDKQREALLLEAKKRDFEAHLVRNGKYIMEEKKPEYLLIFLNHEKPDPDSKGWAYPAVSAKVYNHPNMKNYEEIGRMPKVGNVYNHVFKRKDVPREVPEQTQLRRLFRVVERNPRMPNLVLMLYEHAQEMSTITDEQREHVNEIARTAMKRWQGDPVMVKLAFAARRSGDTELARVALESSLEKNSRDPSAYLALANAYQQEGEFEKALAIVKRGMENVHGLDNRLAYEAVWMSERLGRVNDAIEYARAATKRNSGDIRAWSDLGSTLDRAAMRGEVGKIERLEMQREALLAFNQMKRLQRTESTGVNQTIARLEKSIGQLEKDLNIPPSSPSPSQGKTPAPRTPIPPTPKPPPTPAPRAEPTDPPTARIEELSVILSPRKMREESTYRPETDYDAKKAVETEYK